jgi:hypothetical protein
MPRRLKPPLLHQDVEHLAVLIHCPPQIMPYLVDRDEHFIQMPLITWPETPATEGIRIRLAKLAAPLADRFVRHEDTTDEQELFDVAMAEREAEREPDRVANDLAWESMMFVGIGGGRGRHSSSISSHGCEKSALLP